MSHLDVHGESNLTHRSHEQASLSQHHLGTMSVILEDATSYCSLSQHSMSPSSNYQATQIHDKEHNSGLENNDEWKKELEEQTDADLNGRGNSCGLSSGKPVRSFQKLLEKDIGVASSSAPSSSETDLSQTENQTKHSAISQKQDPACTSTKEHQFRSSESRKQPQGGSASLLSQKRTLGRGSVSLSNRLSAVSNITVRSTSRQADGTTDLPLRQLQLHSESSLAAPEGSDQTENKNTPIGQNVPLASEGGGLQRALWSSGSNHAADGSFLSSQPVFQSTPAVLLGREALAAPRLSPVYSTQDTVATSTQNSTPKLNDIPALALSTSSHPNIAGGTIATSLDPGEAHTESHLQHEIAQSQEAPSPVVNVPVIADEDTPLDQPSLAKLLPTSDQQLKNQEPSLSEGRVHSLPSLSYVQKVDAWKANQSSSRPFYDNLSLQGFEGVHSKRKEQDSVSEAIKQQSQQHSNKTSSEFSANCSTPLTQTGSGMQSYVDVAGGAIGSTSPSPFTQSCSHSSLGTVITPVQQDELQQNQNQSPLTHIDTISPGINSAAAESALSSSETNNQRPADDSGTSPLKPPALVSVDQYSGINVNNMSNTVSNFQASTGAASSVVSLELDNYAPYWTSRPGSPRRPPEFNIEDRIPVSKNKL